MLTVFDSRYRLKGPIGTGGFGAVFFGEDIKAHREVAIKIQSDPAKLPELQNEAEIYDALKGTTGFPMYYGQGCDHERHYIAVELLGKSVDSLSKEHGRKFSLKTCLMLIDQMIMRIEYVHNKGYIHKDLKPENFLLGMGSKSNTVHLIDFGLSVRYLDKDGNHLRGNNWQEFAGTPIFASVNTMSGDSVSRRDDMQSLGYVFVYLMLGTLPWIEIIAGTRDKAQFPAILASKTSTSPEKLCAGLPEEFARYMKAVTGLAFEERPDYAGYRQMFRDLFIRSGFVYDNKFDWLQRLKPQLSFTADVKRQMLLAETTRNNSSNRIQPGARVTLASHDHRREMSSSNSQFRHLRQFVNVSPGQRVKSPRNLASGKPC